MRNHTQNGFTLIELMVTITVLAVLMSIGVPSLRDFLRNNRITTSVNDLVAATTVARSEAIKRRTNISVCPSNNATAAAPVCATGADADWAKGWVTFEDSDGDASIDSGEEILQQHKAAGELITIIADAALAEYISFARNGLTRTTSGDSLTGSLVVCDDRGYQTTGSDISIARGLSISRTGRPQVLNKQSLIDALGIDCP